jgi:hypothetical protein
LTGCVHDNGVLLMIDNPSKRAFALQRANILVEAMRRRRQNDVSSSDMGNNGWLSALVLKV